MAPVNFAEQQRRDDDMSSSSRASRSRSRSDDRYDDDYFEDDYDERHGRKKKGRSRRGRRGVNPALIVAIIIAVAAIIAVLMIMNPFALTTSSQTPEQMGSSVEVTPTTPAEKVAPNTDTFEGVWRPVSFKTSAAEDIISDEDIRIAMVRGYGNGIVLNADGTGQFLLMSDDSLDVLYKEHKDANADTVEQYLAEGSEFEWSKVNEKEATTTYDVSKLDVSKIKVGATHASFTTVKLQLRKQKLFMTFDDGSYISFDKESDSGSSLALMALSDDDKSQIDQMYSAYQTVVNDKMGGYTADELQVQMNVAPTVLADGYSLMFVDDDDRWCAVYYLDAKGSMTGKTLWVDRAGGYEETAGKTPAPSETSSASSASAESTGYEKGTLTNEQFDKFKKAVDAVPTMTIAQVEEILGEANGTVDDENGELSGYFWNAEDASWQLRVWFDTSNIYQKYEELKADKNKKEKADESASSEAAAPAEG